MKSVTSINTAAGSAEKSYYPAGGARSWRKHCTTTIYALLIGACGNRAVDNVNAPTAVSTSSKVEAAPTEPPPPPLQIVDGEPPFPDTRRYMVAQSIAAAAHDDLKLIAQARYCWPSVRPDGPLEERMAALALAGSRGPLPPKC